MQPRTLRSLAAWLLVTLLGACAHPASTDRPTISPTLAASSSPGASPSLAPSPSAASSAGAPATLIAAGDIASCDETGDSATAELVAGLDGTVAMLGDGVYPAGSDETYASCYDPVWGAWHDRTRPALGNHDAVGDGGAAYFRYFGSAAGEPGQGWYSYELGAWHVVVLNSNCDLVGCGEGSDQLEWLADDLASSDARCTLAYWHHPRFSSGPHGDDPAVGPFWEALLADRAELVLAGHDHQYERFAPQDADGVADPNGLRQLTIGTGGKQLRPAVRTAPNSEVIIDDAFGVIVLDLSPDGYGWQFLLSDGTAGDAGNGTCH
jgi:alkaline phosphatase